MLFSEVVRRRRMVRRYDPDAAVPLQVVRQCLANATRAPSAGFSQGWDFLVLSDAAERARFWTVTSGGGPADRWLSGVMDAPVLVVCLSDKEAYLDRYAEPDKGWVDRDEARWPVPYWDVDTGMAALLMLLTATDEGYGSLFFGVPPQRHDAVRDAFAIPVQRRLVGVVALGAAVPGPRSPSLKRGRRGVEQVSHWGRFGQRNPPAASDPN